MPPNRSAQRSRTRQAILDGARQLLAEGLPVTVAAAAARNGVSKATSYRYFADPDVLVAETVLDVAVRPYEEVIGNATDLRGKIRAICLYFLDLAIENETGFRQYLAAAIRDKGGDSATLRRGGRRVAMLNRAIGETRNGLSPKEAETLVRGLSTATGMEALIVLTDVTGATREDARDVTAFMVDAMMDRMGL